MKTESKRISKSTLIFDRKGGSGTHYGATSTQDLPDKGAQVQFSNRLYNDSLNIEFGYISASYKNYSRDLTLKLDQIIELRNFLNEIIDKEAIENSQKP